MYGNDPNQVRTKGRGNSFYSFYKYWLIEFSCSNEFSPVKVFSSTICATRLAREFLIFSSHLWWRIDQGSENSRKGLILFPQGVDIVELSLSDKARSCSGGRLSYHSSIVWAWLGMACVIAIPLKRYMQTKAIECQFRDLIMVKALHLFTYSNCSLFRWLGLQQSADQVPTSPAIRWVECPKGRRRVELSVDVVFVKDPV